MMKTWHTSEGLDLGTHTLWYVGSWTLAYGGLDMQSLTLVKELMKIMNMVSEEILETLEACDDDPLTLLHMWQRRLKNIDVYILEEYDVDSCEAL